MPTALVFGSSGTCGGAIAAELGARGFEVGLHCHTRREACEALRAQLIAAGRQAEIFQGDATDANALNEIAVSFVKRFGRIDACVWACGRVGGGLVAMQDAAEMRAIVTLHLKAPFLVLKSFSRQFIKQKSGSVLVLGSHAGLTGRVGGSAYAMAQSGLFALVKSAAREWGGIGVRVNAVVAPLIKESGMGQAASAELAAEIERRRVFKGDADALKNFARFCGDVLGKAGVSGQVLISDSRVV